MVRESNRRTGSPALRLLLSCVLATVPALACANSLFVCTTPEGRRITSDRMPIECSTTTVRELNPDGSTRRVIEPPLTPEQRSARQEAARKLAEEKERRRAQSRQDLALMETYASEDEIISTRDRTLAQRRVLIERAEQRLLSLKKEHKKLEDEKEFYVDRKMPDKLVRAFAANAEMIAAQHKQIADVQAEMDRISARFDAEAARFRELVTEGAKPLARLPTASN